MTDVQKLNFDGHRFGLRIEYLKKSQQMGVLLILFRKYKKRSVFDIVFNFRIIVYLYKAWNDHFGKFANHGMG